MADNSQKHLGVTFFLLFLPVAYFSYLFHELGHWTVGELLGNRMAYSLNFVSPRAGHYLHDRDALFVSIGGPAFSILQAALALAVIEKSRSVTAYPFAFFAMFTRFFSLLLGGFSKQDEARISLLLGTWDYLVPIFVLGILLLIAVRCSFRLGLRPRMIGYILVVCTACQLLVIGTYEYFKV